MSAVAITIAALMKAKAVTDIVDNKIVNVVSEDSPPNILVNLTYEDGQEMLEGPVDWYESRVSINCRSTRPAEIHKIGKAVIDALRPIHLERFDEYEASFNKAGSDVTEFGDEASIATRTIDFTVRWRSVQ